MNSLVLGLALSGSAATPAQPPLPPPLPPGTPVVSPYRPGLPAGYPTPPATPSQPGYPSGYAPGYPPAYRPSAPADGHDVPEYRPPYQSGYPYPGRPALYPPVGAPVPAVPTYPAAPAVPQPTFAPPFAPGEPYPGRHGPMTLEQFAHCFKPTPGHHEFCVIHPRTGQPVHFCLNLPPGCPRVTVGRREIELDYGKLEIEVTFERNGRVDVDYDD